jgi:hypothetical protein
LVGSLDYPWLVLSYEILARIFHELLWRDHEDGCATWQPSRATAGLVPRRTRTVRRRGRHPRTPGRMAILFALAALRSVPQAGSQFRGRRK